MKKTLIFSILALSVLMYHCGTKNESIGISTNYFDLPEKDAEELAEVLELDTENNLTQKSVKVLHMFLYPALLNKNTPFQANIRLNYFWNIYNALPDFVSEKERHTGYYQGESDSKGRTGLLAYSFYRLDRSPENLKRIYQYLKPNLKGWLTKENYDRFGFAQEINNLLYSYGELIQIPNYRKHLADAYAQIDTTTGQFIDNGETMEFRKFENSAYGFSVYEMNEIISKHLELDRYSTIGESQHLSFWMRRNHEGNMETVYEIIAEVYNLYK